MVNAFLGAVLDVLLPLADRAVLLTARSAFFAGAGEAIVDIREVVRGTAEGTIDGLGRRLLDVEGAIVALGLGSSEGGTS